jgi:hypothetical protein
MKIPELFKEYIWLVNVIHQAGNISLAEINEKWLQTDMSQGVEMARSTFNRHREAIEDIFGIIIECKRRGGYCYYISNEHVLREDTIQNWMLSTLSVSNVVFESLRLQDRILLETIPAAGTILKEIVKAMRKNLRAIIHYRKYGTETIKEVKIELYCIKLYHRRWYVLAHQEEENKFRVYSFDRILDISITKETFSMPKDFNASEFFWECFGIVKDDNTPLEQVLIRAFGKERYYMRDLPFHHSQKMVCETDEYVDFEMSLRPTLDFMGHLLSRSSQIKVLQPQWLADKVRQMLEESIHRYDE